MLYFQGPNKFLVVAGDRVVKEFNDLEKAKERLNRIPVSAPILATEWKYGSRMIAEVDRHGVLMRDPHFIDMTPQDPSHGFKKWWSGWENINFMMDICEKYLHGNR